MVNWKKRFGGRDNSNDVSSSQQIKEIDVDNVSPVTDMELLTLIESYEKQHDRKNERQLQQQQQSPSPTKHHQREPHSGTRTRYAHIVSEYDLPWYRLVRQTSPVNNHGGDYHFGISYEIYPYCDHELLYKVNNQLQLQHLIDSIDLFDVIVQGSLEEVLDGQVATLQHHQLLNSPKVMRLSQPIWITEDKDTCQIMLNSPRRKILGCSNSNNYHSNVALRSLSTRVTEVPAATTQTTQASKSILRRPTTSIYQQRAQSNIINNNTSSTTTAIPTTKSVSFRPQMKDDLFTYHTEDVVLASGDDDEGVKDKETSAINRSGGQQQSLLDIDAGTITVGTDDEDDEDYDDDDEEETTKGYSTADEGTFTTYGGASTATGSSSQGTRTTSNGTTATTKNHPASYTDVASNAITKGALIGSQVSQWVSDLLYSTDDEQRRRRSSMMTVDSTTSGTSSYGGGGFSSLEEDGGTFTDIEGTMTFDTYGGSAHLSDHSGSNQSTSDSGGGYGCLCVGPFGGAGGNSTTDDESGAECLNKRERFALLASSSIEDVLRTLSNEQTTLEEEEDDDDDADGGSCALSFADTYTAASTSCHTASRSTRNNTSSVSCFDDSARTEEDSPDTTSDDATDLRCMVPSCGTSSPRCATTIGGTTNTEEIIAEIFTSMSGEDDLRVDSGDDDDQETSILDILTSRSEDADTIGTASSDDNEDKEEEQSNNFDLRYKNNNKKLTEITKNAIKKKKASLFNPPKNIVKRYINKKDAKIEEDEDVRDDRNKRKTTSTFTPFGDSGDEQQPTTTNDDDDEEDEGTTTEDDDAGGGYAKLSDGSEEEEEEERDENDESTSNDGSNSVLATETKTTRAVSPTPPPIREINTEGFVKGVLSPSSTENNSSSFFGNSFVVSPRKKAIVEGGQNNPINAPNNREQQQRVAIPTPPQQNNNRQQIPPQQHQKQQNAAAFFTTSSSPFDAVDARMELNQSMNAFFPSDPFFELNQKATTTIATSSPRKKNQSSNAAMQRQGAPVPSTSPGIVRSPRKKAGSGRTNAAALHGVQGQDDHHNGHGIGKQHNVTQSSVENNVSPRKSGKKPFFQALRVTSGSGSVDHGDSSTGAGGSGYHTSPRKRMGVNYAMLESTAAVSSSPRKISMTRSTTPKGVALIMETKNVVVEEESWKTQTIMSRSKSLSPKKKSSTKITPKGLSLSNASSSWKG